MKPRICIVDLSKGGQPQRVVLPDGPMSLEIEIGKDRILRISLIDECDEGLEVSCIDGRILLRPHVANKVSIDVEDF